MGNRKLKYRDVVKKQGPKSNKRPPKHNKKIPFKKRKAEFPNSKLSKKPRFEEAPKKLVPLPESESEEEEETAVDYMLLLRESFGEKIQKIKDEAMTSESSSESEEEPNEVTKKPGIEDALKLNADVEEKAESDVEEEDNLENSEDPFEESEDPFIKHISYELHPSLLENLESSGGVEVHKKTWPQLGALTIQIPKCPPNEIKKTLLETTIYATPGPIPKKLDPKSSASDLGIKSQIIPNIPQSNKSLINKEKSFLTPLQQEIFSIINNYQDLYYPERTFDNAEEIRFIYCLHALNHVLKTRTKVLHHNSKLSKKDIVVPEEFRDQGLVRPKVLIVTPFKNSAYKIINTLIGIMFKDDSKGVVANKNRFVEDYTGNELHFPKKNPRPEDYEKMFAGNTSDDFKIGLSMTKKTIKLYADFYASDIIVASPLGLRTIIGAPGESDRDFDFLASIELLILDQTDVFFMQNWFHVLHLFEHLHLKPKELHGTDVSRVRQWSLNLCAKYYRQTLVFSSIMLPHLEALFARQCWNYAGKVKVANKVERGSVNGVYVQMQHVFRKFSAGNGVEMVEKRFEFFVQKVLPAQRDSGMRQTLIYVPSYYDYVRLRNYFKSEDLSFVQICEYSKDSKVARARDMFYHGDAHFLLYTERYHFYHRIKLKGVRHLIFYQPPTYPHFYSEMCNLMQEYNMNKKVGSMDNMSVTVIYTKLDLLQLAPIVGTERAVRVTESDRDVHMFLTAGI
ncbi:U3 small nucleolar RNA-associated protein 25 homolog [Euwallacea fornicatus]|uniref:U3 small nucleolar RNA-associated protein 25 homolog n=1 Tax=Euwallacea fornicatus TaxID=995702 RepID=UPI00338FCC12